MDSKTVHGETEKDAEASHSRFALVASEAGQILGWPPIAQPTPDWKVSEAGRKKGAGRL